jgi:hypothetical protein
VAIAGVLMVVVVLLVRPQEFVPALQALGVLNVATAIAAIGIVFETFSGKQASPWTPQTPWLCAFLVWCFFVTVRRLGLEGLPVAWANVGLSAIFMLVVTAAAGSLARWRTVATTLVAVGTLIAAVCIHQAQQPWCVADAGAR